MLCFPETAGLSLEEVQMVFQHGFGIKESYRLRKEKAALQHEKHEQPENEKEETA